MGLFSKVYGESYAVKNSVELLKAEPAIKNGVVESGEYGLSVRFNLKSGGYGFLPLSKSSSLAEGDEFPIAGAQVLTLGKEGVDDIVRVIEA
jgi:hypothetical protein